MRTVRCCKAITIGTLFTGRRIIVLVTLRLEVANYSFVQSFCVFAELTRIKGIEFSVGTTSARPCDFEDTILQYCPKLEAIEWTNTTTERGYLIQANGRSLTPMAHLKDCISMIVLFSL